MLTSLKNNLQEIDQELEARIKNKHYVNKPRPNFSKLSHVSSSGKITKYEEQFNSLMNKKDKKFSQFSLNPH